MISVTTKAIVFSSIKYGDSSLIVKCFTEKEGLKSYLIRGVLKSKKGALKPAYFQPLTQLQLVANHTNKNTLHSIKEANVVQPYNTIYSTVVKQTIAMFLSEVLSYIIVEEEENKPLYNYLEAAFTWLDTHTAISNFHLLFLMNLSRFLGFYPDVSQKDKNGFSLIDGHFTDAVHQNLVIYNQDLQSFKKLLNIGFDEIENIPFSKLERQKLLQIIIQYFNLHLNNFKQPKSLPILKSIFS